LNALNALNALKGFDKDLLGADLFIEFPYKDLRINFECSERLARLARFFCPAKRIWKVCKKDLESLQKELLGTKNFLSFLIEI